MEGRARKSKEEEGRIHDVRLRWCTRVPPPPLRFQIASEFLLHVIGFSIIGVVFLIHLVFSHLFPQCLVFSPTLLVSRPSVCHSFCGVSLLLLSHPYGCSHSPIVFSSSLMVLSHPFRFFPPPFWLFSHCVVYQLFQVVFPHRGFWRLFGFYLPVICFVRIPLRFFIVWVFYQSLCVFPTLLVLLPFLFLF